MEGICTEMLFEVLSMVGPLRSTQGYSTFFYFVHIKIIFYYVLYFLTFVLILDKYMFG